MKKYRTDSERMVYMWIWHKRMKAIANPQQGSISTTLDFALVYTVTNTSNTIVKTREEPGRTVTLVNCDKG